MTSIFEGQPLKTRFFPSKRRVKQTKIEQKKTWRLRRGISFLLGLLVSKFRGVQRVEDGFVFGGEVDDETYR